MPPTDSSTSTLAETSVLPSVSAGFVTGFVALLGAAFAMSISPTLVRLADVGPFSSAFWRVALALPVLWLWMRQAEAQSGDGRHTRYSTATMLAGLAFSSDLFFWHLSITKTTVANATFFATTAPIWVIVFGWLLFRDRVGLSVVWGLALCICGGAALVAQSFAFNPGRIIGDGLGLVTGVFFGLYFLAVRAARAETGAARVTFEVSVMTAAILFVVAMLLEPHFLPRSAAGWGTLLALALVSHAGGQGLLSVALGRVPAAFSSLVIFLESIAAAGFAWMILGEPVTAVQAIGGLVIVGGIWIARPRNQAAPG